VFLKSLSLKGFKSFADPAVLEFEPGITVVVGPNGSGKSNVVDAVAWVLGAQGPRTVRSQKMEDVIFAGTANRPALGRAEVTLTIDNSARRLHTDLAEITITRTLFRSGESEYALNGTPCRLLDIQELLSDTGVGRQQHVIVSQGNLDAVLEARPEDRRAIIEEAAGVLKFRRRRERAERRLAATQENLERLYDLVREVKRQIKPLERQAKAAQSHAVLADELRAVKLYSAGAELRSLQGRHDDGGRLRDELRATEEGLRATLAELDVASERTAGELSAERESDIAAALARAEGMVERARGLIGVLRERGRTVAQALDAAADIDVVSTLEAEAARLSGELISTESDLVALEPDHEELAVEEEATAADLETHLAAEVDGASLRQKERALTEARGQLTSLERAVDRDRRSLDQLTARLATAERRAVTLEGEHHEVRERLAECEQARHRLQTEVAEAEEEHRRAAHRLEVADASVRQAEQELHRSVARADALERALDEARGAAGAELLADLDGVVGTLLDLVEIDNGWEEATEAACGASLAAVVVSGSQPARAALARLRSGGMNGLVLALTGGRDAGGGADAFDDMKRDLDAAPLGAEPVRNHVRARSGRAGAAELEGVLDRLLEGAYCTSRGWSEAIDLALSRPDLVVVTRDGDRFSPTGWRVRAEGGTVTAALVDEARSRAAMAEHDVERISAERSVAYEELEGARQALAAAVRADDRNEIDQQSARAASQRIAEDLDAVTAEIEGTGGDRAEIQDRIERDHARISAIQQALPGLEAEQAAAAERSAMVAEERRHIDARGTELAGRRTALDARQAGLAERRRVLTERMAEVERRLTGHTDERQLAAERRRRLEGEATAIRRLAELVESCREELDVHLAGLREEHRRRLDAVRLGGERLESLRRQRTADEQRMTEVRGRLSQVEMDLVEASVRHEAVVETLRRELGAGPEEATSAPEPELPEGVDAATRIEQLEAELAAMGPVNPLALEELAEHTERHRFLESQVEDVRTARRELHQIIRTLDDEIMRVFAEAFADVNEHFSNLVSSLFPGGMGRLTLTDAEQLLDTGVEVEARPAGRNVRRLSLLSGGERSLVAMAFLFAIFRSRPSPFYLMDEVEAALDDVNLQRFLGLVHEFRDEAQLIVVSHQKRTMEAADALYGVTMAPGGSSQVLSQRVPRTDDSPLPDGFAEGAGTFGNGTTGNENGNVDDGTQDGASGSAPVARHDRPADGPPPRPVPSADEAEATVDPESMEDAETLIGQTAGGQPVGAEPVTGRRSG
jgi:chromosome segregation protein